VREIIVDGAKIMAIKRIIMLVVVDIKTTTKMKGMIYHNMGQVEEEIKMTEAKKREYSEEANNGKGIGGQISKVPNVDIEVAIEEANNLIVILEDKMRKLRKTNNNGVKIKIKKIQRKVIILIKSNQKDKYNGVIPRTKLRKRPLKKAFNGINPYQIRKKLRLLKISHKLLVGLQQLIAKEICYKIMER
jgi:hypothetical protein